jgi:hypothetical protein
LTKLTDYVDLANWVVGNKVPNKFLPKLTSFIVSSNKY